MQSIIISPSLCPLQVLREMISEIPEKMEEKVIIDTLVVKDPSNDLESIARTESRVFLLYRWAFPAGSSSFPLLN